AARLGGRGRDHREEAREEEAARPEQAGDEVGIGPALGGIDRAEARVLPDAVEEGGVAPREREDVALLERDVEPLLPRELARRLKGLRGEVEAPHAVPPPGQEPAVVAAAAAEDGHPPQRRGGPRE